MTWSPSFTPALTSTAVPKSRTIVDLADMGDAVLDHRYAEPLAIEYDRLRRARSATASCAGFSARRCNRPRAAARGRDWARRSRSTACGCRAAAHRRSASPCRESRGPGISGTRTIASTPGRDAEGLVLRHVKLDADHVALHQREHEGAAGRVGLHQAADIDIALRDRRRRRERRRSDRLSAD